MLMDLYNNLFHEWKLFSIYLIKMSFHSSFIFHSTLFFKRNKIKFFPAFYRKISLYWKKHLARKPGIPSCILSQYISEAERKFFAPAPLFSLQTFYSVRNFQNFQSNLDYFIKILTSFCNEGQFNVTLHKPIQGVYYPSPPHPLPLFSKIYGTMKISRYIKTPFTVYLEYKLYLDLFSTVF